MRGKSKCGVISAETAKFVAMRYRIMNWLKTHWPKIVWSIVIFWAYFGIVYWFAGGMLI